MQHGILHYYRGILTGVKGFIGKIQEYHFVKVPNQKDPYLLTRDFHHYPSDISRDHSRPTPSRAYQPTEYIDIRIDNEAKDILDILFWRANGGKTRNLCFQRHHAQHLTKSLTHATLAMGIITDEDRKSEEKPVLNTEDFGYIISYMTGGENSESETGVVT